MAKKGKFEQPRRHEVDELEEAFQQVTAQANGGTVYRDTAEPEPETPAGKNKKNKSGSIGKKKGLIIGSSVLALVLLIGICVGVWYYLDLTEDDGLIYSNVTIYGIDLGGMTREEAVSTVQSQLADQYENQNLVVHLPDYDLIFSPTETKVSLDVEQIVEDAYAYGRTGSRWEQYQAKAKAQLTTHELTLTDYLSINTSYISQVLEQAGEDAASELVETTVTITGDVPDLNMTYYEAQNSETEHVKITITMGTPYQSLDTQTLYKDIVGAYMTMDFTPITVAYEIQEPAPLDLEPIYNEYCVAPVDAELDESDYSVTPEVLGYGFDLEAAKELVAGAAYGETVEITMAYQDAEVTLDDLEQYLFKDVLAKVDTIHTNIANRTTNLKLACQAINGTVLRPGETFSFNKVVGERTAAKGYKEATVYVGGASVPQLGGGICQVASSIYYAVLLADLEVVSRTEHMYAVDYVPLGMDATVYWGSLDFKFKNNTDYPIRIEASVSGGEVHIKLIGTDTKDYYVKMTYEVTDGPNYGETKYKVYAEDNEEGYKDGEVIQTSYTGRSVKTYKSKYSKATNKLISTTYVDSSTYAKRDKIICIIGDPTAPTDESGKPIETTAEPTVAPTTEATEPSTEAPTEAPTEATAPPTESTPGESGE